MIGKRMAVPVFSGVLLAFSRVFLYWLMGVCVDLHISLMMAL
jgi:hypothetical protein